MLVAAANDRLAACCDECFRSSPTLDADPQVAQRILESLGWELSPTMACPICRGRRSAKILVSREE